MIAPGDHESATLAEAILGHTNEADESATPYFSLEYQLRDFIASNLNAIDVDGRRLRLYVNYEGRDGIEYPSTVGPIDILAIDAEGSFFVFELKRAESPDRAIGQVSRYMGWIKQTIGKGCKVYGVIVSKTVSENLKYAKVVMPDIFLFEYELLFSIKQVLEIS